MNELEKSKLSWLVDNTNIDIDRILACDFSEKGFCRYRGDKNNSNCGIKENSTAHIACNKKLKDGKNTTI